MSIPKGSRGLKEFACGFAVLLMHSPLSPRYAANSWPCRLTRKKLHGVPKRKQPGPLLVDLKDRTSTDFSQHIHLLPEESSYGCHRKGALKIAKSRT